MAVKIIKPSPPNHLATMLLTLLTGASCVSAEIYPDKIETMLLEEVIVLGTRDAERLFDLPYSAYLVSKSKLKENSYRTVPQALRDIPGIMVQETAMGQGSPYIRGFTGFRNLFLIDGIRMNNSTFRDGPNQYWGTIDSYGLSGLEVVNGVNSALHGTDAIGGTVNALTTTPKDNYVSLLYRSSSAESSDIWRGQAGITFGTSTAVTFGFTTKNFGDLKGGDNLGTQTNVGYDENDFDIKLVSQLPNNSTLAFFHQTVQQNEVPRTHKTIYAKSWEGTSVGKDLQRTLDQNRTLSYARYQQSDLSDWLEQLTLTASYQQTEEERDRIKPSGSDHHQGFNVDTTGLSAQLISDSKLGKWIYGFDYYADAVSSFSSSNDIQGPVADDANYTMLDFYLQDQVGLTDALGLIVGARYSEINADAKSVFDPSTGKATSITDEWNKVVASLRLNYQLLPERLNLYGGISQGFRAPNLSDLTRLDSARTDEFETPSPGLDPENFVSYEIGLKWKTSISNFAIAYFYTDIKDMIVRVPTGNQINGEHEITKANIGDGYTEGVEIIGRTKLSQQFTLFGQFTWFDGEVDTYPTSEPIKVSEPIDRKMPLSANLGVRWQAAFEMQPYLEFKTVYAATANDLSTRDANDTSRIPPGGTPPYTTYNLNGGLVLTPWFELNLAVDNLTNKDYRVHGSGTNMPGRNVIVSASIMID